MITLFKSLLSGLVATPTGTGPVERAAYGALPPVIGKGSIAPFDRVGVIGSGTADKLREPFRNSVWVQAAIRHVIAPICAVNLQFARDTRGGQQVVTDPALTAFWAAPAIGPRNTRLKLGEVIEVSLSWLLLEGEYFWIQVDGTNVPFPEVDGSGGLKPFIIARPDRMEAVIERGELVMWRFTDGAKRKHLLDPARVIHEKCVNPYSDFRGLAPMESAHDAAEADYLAGRFNVNLMANNGDTGPFIIAKSGIPSDPQREQIVMDLRAKRLAQLRGDFRPMFLTGDIEVQDPGIKSMDAAMIASRIENRHEVFIAFGVPPSMADVKAAYSIGSASDQFHLIINTCVPYSEKFCNGVEQHTARSTGRAVAAAPPTSNSGNALYASFDFNRHPVMVAARNERIQNGTLLWDRGMPWEKINEFLDLRLPEFPSWEIGYLPFSVAPSDQVNNPPEDPALDPALAEEEDEDATPEEPVKEMLAAFRGEPAVGQSCRSAQTNESLWKSHVRIRAPKVRAFQAKTSKVFNDFRVIALRRLASVPQEKSPTTRSLIDIIFSKVEFGAALFKTLQPTIRSTLQAASLELLKETRQADDAWTMPSTDVLRFIRTRENLIKDCGDTAFKQLQTQLDEANEKGESIAEITDRVKGVFNDLSKHEAKRIAMTETGAAYGFARDEAMRGTGVQFKAWLSSHGPNVRQTHRAAELAYGPGSPIPIDMPFRVGADELMYPGDPKGSPGEIINCQCIQLAVKKEDDQS